MNRLDLDVFLVKLLHIGIAITVLLLMCPSLLFVLLASSFMHGVLVSLRLLNDFIGLELLCELE